MIVVQQAVYMYAVVPANSRLDAIPAPVDVRLIRAGGVAVVAGDADVAELGRLNQTGSDAEQLATLATQHDAVVRAAMSAAGTVLPFRLATVLTDDQAVCAFATERSTEMKALLERLADTVEWGVRISVDQQRPAQSRPESRPEPAAERPGTMHLARRRRELAEAQRQGAERSDAARNAALELRADVLDTRPNLPRGAVLVDDVYLVRNPDLPRFLDTADRIRTRLAHDGLQLRLTGPWPPYSFARSEAFHV
jgi:hypothetical protein